jgi:hypothetical protein
MVVCAQAALVIQTNTVTIATSDKLAFLIALKIFMLFF